MPSSVHATMLTEMQGGQRIYPVFELVLGATTLRFAERPVASFGNGLYLPYLTSMSGFTRSANLIDYSLIIPSPSVTIFDQDRVLQKAIGGPQKNAIRDSVARCYFRTDVDSVTHYKFFDGVVSDYKMSGERSWNFVLNPAKTEILLGEPKIPYMSKTDFPDAPTSVIGEPLWIIYGKHSSIGISGATGMVSALPAILNSNGDATDWVLSYGDIDIQKIFRTISGNIIEDTTNWTTYSLERGKNRYFMGRYTGGATKPLPTDDVRIDCTGLFSTAPVSATKTPFENPSTCIRNFLAHFIYGDGDLREGVTWTSETGLPIASAIFDSAATYFTDRGHVMAKVIYSNDKGINVFNNWCKSWNAVPFWSDTWSIAAIPDNESDIDIYQDTRHIKQIERHTLSEISMDTSRTKFINEIVINYLLDEAAGQLTESRIISDTTNPNLKRDTFNFEWGDKSLLG